MNIQFDVQKISFMIEQRLKTLKQTHLKNQFFQM